MKKKPYWLMGLSALSLIYLSSCVDKDYDLSDIDTTAKFVTKNLVVPINLDVITLDQVLDLNDDSEIVKTTDGDGNLVYAIKKEGNFQSEKIEVEPFTILSPHINDTNTNLSLEDLRLLNNVSNNQGGRMAYYPITGNVSQVSFNTNPTHFDESIQQIDHLGVETKYITIIKVEGLSPKAISNCKLTGMKIQYPKGLDVEQGKGTYNPISGVLDLSSETLALDNNGEVKIELGVHGMSYSSENVTANFANHTISYKGDIQILEGDMGIYVDTELPATIKMTVKYTLADIHVDTFTGKVEYQLEDFDIEPIHINNLPDILSQSGTKIDLENPQIYLSMTNPLYQYNIKFQTDLSLTAQREGQSKTYRPDNGAFSTTTAKAADNEFVLSPTKPDYYFEGFTSPQFVPFSGLKTVLSDVGGIPELITVEADDPKMPSQQVADFKLGKQYNGVEGQYAFFAPLQLSDQACIVYSDTIDGWNDKDVDAITIDTLKLSFDATTDVPFEVELTISPINTTGKAITGVKPATAHLAAQAKDEHVNVALNGQITNLDGIILKAKLLNVGNNATLAPNMKLQMKNVRATVTGAYEKEL